MKVCLDAGHGLNTAGKRTPTYEDGTIIHESEQNYPVMFKLGEYLEYNGFDVIYTNTDIKFDMTLEQRVNVSNVTGCDLFVSLHKNAVTGEWQTTSRGIETYVYKTGGMAEMYATFIQDELIKDSKMLDRGVKTGNYYVLKYTDCPAVLVELGFMDYRLEADQMYSVEWYELYAKSITKGICYCCGLNPMFPKSESDISWQQTQGLEAIDSLVQMGYIQNGEDWKSQDLTQPMPMWTAFTLIDRLARDIKAVIKVN